MTVPAWFADFLAWKPATKKAARRCDFLFGAAIGPNLADLSSTSSARIAGRMYELAAIPTTKRTSIDLSAVDGEQDSGPTDRSAGSQLEQGLERDIRASLNTRDAHRGWIVTRSGGVDQFSQYAHLKRLQELFRQDVTLKSTVGRDYQVSTDVMVGVPNQWEDDAALTLHAAISSKLTIRSDRVQNIRYEFATLVRNRRGRLPHLVVVTAEPLPSRLLSIARGTGEIDAVYHLMYDELDASIAQLDVEVGLADQADAWHELVETKRIRPYSELADVLAAS